MVYLDFTSRCGSRTGGQSFVKVRDARRSPETRAWRTCRWAAKQDQRKSGWKRHQRTRTATSFALLLPRRLLMWPHLQTLARRQTLMLHSTRYDFAPLQISPLWQGSASATHLTSRLWECCRAISASPQSSGPSYSSIAPSWEFIHCRLQKTALFPFRRGIPVKLPTLTGGSNRKPFSPDSKLSYHWCHWFIDICRIILEWFAWRVLFQNNKRCITFRDTADPSAN